MALLIPASRQNVDAVDGKDAVITTTTGALLTAHATPHTLGTITQIIASTVYEAEWIEITVHEMEVSATVTDALLNLYIGAAGFETLLIDSLQVGWSAVITTKTPNVFWFPVRIPLGSRISGALRALITVDTCEVMIRYGTSNGAHWVGSGVETLGEVTTASRGTNVTPATAAPAWATIGTSDRRYKYIVVGVQGNNDATAANAYLSWTIGEGSAMLQGLGGIGTYISGSEYHLVFGTGRWCDIASGTILQLRSWASGAPSGAVAATLHGVY